MSFINTKELDQRIKVFNQLISAISTSDCFKAMGLIVKEDPCPLRRYAKEIVVYGTKRTYDIKMRIKLAKRKTKCLVISHYAAELNRQINHPPWLNPNKVISISLTTTHLRAFKIIEQMLLLEEL
jgi:hypothetical protein